MNFCYQRDTRVVTNDIEEYLFGKMQYFKKLKFTFLNIKLSKSYCFEKCIFFMCKDRWIVLQDFWARQFIDRSSCTNHRIVHASVRFREFESFSLKPTTFGDTVYINSRYIFKIDDDDKKSMYILTILFLVSTVERPIKDVWSRPFVHWCNALFWC